MLRGGAPLHTSFGVVRDFRRGSAEVIGDVGNHDVLAEEEGAFDEESRLVVEEMLPPVPGDELGNDDGDHVVLTQGKEVVEVLEERLEKRPVGRAQDYQGNPHAPLHPLLLESSGLLGVELDVYALHGGGQGAWVLERVDDPLVE